MKFQTLMFGALWLLIAFTIVRDYVSNYRKVRYNQRINIISSMRTSDLVFNKITGKEAVVEKVDFDSDIIILDASFGKSTSGLRQAWLRHYGDDGRYSLSLKEAAKRIYPVQKIIKYT